MTALHSDSGILYLTCTYREIQILRELVKDGADNETIARRMKPQPLSMETVKTHLKHVYKKTSISDRTALAVGLLRRDFVVIDEYGQAVEF